MEGEARGSDALRRVLESYRRMHKGNDAAVQDIDRLAAMHGFEYAEVLVYDRRTHKLYGQMLN